MSARVGTEPNSRLPQRAASNSVRRRALIAIRPREAISPLVACMPTYDIAVIGGGTAGITAALSASSRGKRVVLVERAPQLGGDCTFYGCVPSKALIELAKLAHDTRQAAGAGVFDRAPALDFAAVQRESARIVEGIARARARTAGRTSLPNVYVTGGLQFTHVAAQEGRVAGLNAAGKRSKLDLRVTPWVTFTDPEVAHVGLTEAEARERHDDVRVATYPMARVDRARIERRPAGFVKLVTARRLLAERDP